MPGEPRDGTLVEQVGAVLPPQDQGLAVVLGAECEVKIAVAVVSSSARRVNPASATTLGSVRRAWSTTARTLVRLVSLSRLLASCQKASSLNPSL
jgi:hypothetical protein